jgi:hypothetical protein
MFTSRLAALREERVRLSQELTVYTAEAAAAPHGSEEAHLSISAVLEDMEVCCHMRGWVFGQVHELLMQCCSAAILRASNLSVAAGVRATARMPVSAAMLRSPLFAVR